MDLPSQFTPLPDDSNLWIMAADRLIQDEEADHLLHLLSRFRSVWTAHGDPVISAATVLYNRFVVLAAHVPEGHVSGCAIDASTDALKELASALSLRWCDSLRVFYLSDGHVHDVSRSEFRATAREGDITPQTVVFDLSITTLGALRNGSFQKRAEDSWHAALLPRMVQ